MRKEYVLVGMVALAGCGGGGVNSIGGSAAPTGSGGTTIGSSTPDTFVAPTAPHTYSAIGGVQSYQYSTSSAYHGTQSSQLYAADASTARNSDITVSYDPRSAIYEIQIASDAAGVNQTLRFQDPAHRTDFAKQNRPQIGTPDIAGQNIQYLQAGESTGGTVTRDPNSGLIVGEVGASSNIATFFYQKPGTTTQYVTFAGFMRNATSIAQGSDPNNPENTYLVQNNTLERAVFAFGQRTENGSVPTTGSGTYTGNMLATMVYNPVLDDVPGTPTYYQWISGDAKVDVNFATGSVATTFSGNVFAPQIDANTSGMHVLPAGSSFNATGTARVDLPNAGGFVGQIGAASFTTPNTITDPHVVNADGTRPVTGGTTTAVNIAGSSVDGAFYGPAGQEVGGGFRIVGGTPDQRIDILGTFTGARPK